MEHIKDFKVLSEGLAQAVRRGSLTGDNGMAMVGFAAGINVLAASSRTYIETMVDILNLTAVELREIKRMERVRWGCDCQRERMYCHYCLDGVCKHIGDAAKNVSYSMKKFGYAADTVSRGARLLGCRDGMRTDVPDIPGESVPYDVIKSTEKALNKCVTIGDFSKMAATACEDRSFRAVRKFIGEMERRLDIVKVLLKKNGHVFDAVMDGLDCFGESVGCSLERDRNEWWFPGDRSNCYDDHSGSFWRYDEFNLERAGGGCQLEDWRPHDDFFSSYFIYTARNHFKEAVSSYSEAYEKVRSASAHLRHGDSRIRLMYDVPYIYP